MIDVFQSAYPIVILALPTGRGEGKNIKAGAHALTSPRDHVRLIVSSDYQRFFQGEFSLTPAAGANMARVR